jgi:hypothetical protein
MGGHETCMGEMLKNVVGKPERKISLGRPRYRWRILLKLIGYEGVDWKSVTNVSDQLRTLVNTVIDFR